ncbi:MAG: S41 family peptidase [Geodermatophilaceae bacterium]
MAVTPPTSVGAYLRFPSLHGDSVAFVAEDDVWLGDTAGGRAWRLTADRAPVAHTRLSPAGDQVAYTSRRDGAPEVHVVAVEGGPPRRLTHWGTDFTRALGWTDDGRILAASAVGEPFRSRTWAYAVPLDGGPPERLPYGPVNAVAAEPGGAVVLGVHGNRRGAAAWKRYRGGTAGQLWIDPTGEGTFSRLQAGLDGQLEDPAWVGERIAFLSDHEGHGNVYSCLADGSDLRRHTDHGDFYARAAHSDGRRVVYQSVGELWLLDELSATSQPQRLDLVLGGSGTALSRHSVPAADHMATVAADRTGRASAIEVRGSVHWVSHRDGPSRQLTGAAGVRYRLPRVLNGADALGVVMVSDADGDDALEIAIVEGTDQPRRIAGGELGRVLDLAASPDGRLVAAASHDGRVLLVDVESGGVRELSASSDGDASGLNFSPDSRWLAWSHPGPEPLRQIRLANVSDATLIEATPMRFTDTEPVFTMDGKHLAFLSVRTFDPVYDAFVFDLSFLAGTRPYLLPLAQRTPSPFDPSPRGRPMSPDEGKPPSPGGSDGSDGSDKEADAGPPRVTVDADGISERLVAVPVPAGNYSSLRASRGGLLWLLDPLVGVLGDGLAKPGDQPRSAVQRYDLGALLLSTLADKVDAIEVSGDGRWLIVKDGPALRVVPADRKVPEGEEGAADRVEVDLDRIRVEIEPMAEWQQMYAEAGRLMRDHFWIADMGGVDWEAVLERYRPVLARVGTRDDLSELLWEVQGELGSSHAYELPPEREVEKSRRLGLLGADLAPDADGVWRVTRVVPGESSAPAARSPLSAPGVGVQAGDGIVAVGGRAVDPVVGPGALLVGAAETPVELTVLPGDGSEQRHVVLVPLATEMPLRYQDWVTGRRRAVHAASGGRAGYLHIPDMVANGWAQLHRDLRVEMVRDCLVVDVRDNNGGHVSSLVLEKLARTVQGWATVRHMRPTAYPEDAPRGPLVAVTNEQAGSDGDIVTAMIRQLGLGPVVGTRTWGGVIGIDMRYRLVDGTQVTQPRYSFWFTDAGWGVENYGVEPDIEVPFPPQSWAAGADPQLEAAVAVVLERLASRPAATPPAASDRPDRAAPPLPPRP